MGVYILHIDTSSKNCSVAISEDSRPIASEIEQDADHTRVLNGMIRKALTKSGFKLNQMDAISVNEGPGSFTALRIGVVTAKGICFSLDKPLILIPGLKMIASAAKRQFPGYDQYISMIDARRDEVYLSSFNDRLETLISPVSVILDDSVCNWLEIVRKETILAGSGVLKWGDYIQNCSGICYTAEMTALDMIPLALEMFNKSDFTELGPAKPFYLKPPNITMAKDKFISN
jgi:tRNA threonylcarbamoyladenosine biosynthesis protein TsaB